MSHEGYGIKDFGLKGIKYCDSKGIIKSIKIAKYRDYCDYCYYIYISGLYSMLFPLYLLL